MTSETLGLLIEKSQNGLPDKGPCLVTFLNPYSYMVFRSMASDLSRFHRIYPDGGLLVFSLSFLGVRVERRSFDMTSMAPEVFVMAKRKNLSIAFIGGSPGLVEKAVDRFDKEYGLGGNVVFSRHGFFDSPDERREVISSLVDMSPDIVIVGMGTPLQERFLLDLVDAGWEGFGFTCGGFIHQTASHGVKYYPDWINKFGLRWAYRIFDEPKLFKRYLVWYTKFFFFFGKDSFFRRIG